MLAPSGYDSQSLCRVHPKPNNSNGHGQHTIANNIPKCLCESERLIQCIGTYEEELVWSTFEDTREVTLQHALFNHYEYIARNKANYYISKLPYRPIVEPDDIRSEAAYGLLDAILKFRTDRNASFKTYADYIVRGRIIDGIRGMQEFNRRSALVKREIKPLIEKLWLELEHEPTQEELLSRFPDFQVGGYFGIPLREVLPDPLLLSSVFNQSSFSSGNSNDADHDSFSFDVEGPSVFDLYRLGPVNPSLTPELALHREDLWEKILVYLGGYGEDIKSVIYRYYFLGWTSEQIGATYYPKRKSTWVSSKKQEGIRLLRVLFNTDISFAEDLRCLQT